MKLAFSCCGFGEEKLDARVSQDEIGHLYDRLAKIYDIWGTLTESRARNRAIALADIHDGQDILEVAVGTGLAFYEIVKRNPNGKNIGIDLSGGMLEKARERLREISNARYVLNVGTAFNLDLEDESVDIVMNNYMLDLMSFADMDKVLAEFERVLRKGGKLILVGMTKGKFFGNRLYDLVYQIYPKTLGGCRGVQLSDPLRQHGFRVEKREYHQQFLFPSEVILAYK